MIWYLNNCVNRCRLESHPKNSGYPGQILLMVPVSRVKSYGDCAFTACGKGCRQILEMRRLLKMFKSVITTHLFKVAFTDKSIKGFLQTCYLGYHCTSPLNGSY